MNNQRSDVSASVCPQVRSFASSSWLRKLGLLCIALHIDTPDIKTLRRFLACRCAEQRSAAFAGVNLFLALMAASCRMGHLPEPSRCDDHMLHPFRFFSALDTKADGSLDLEAQPCFLTWCSDCNELQVPILLSGDASRRSLRQVYVLCRQASLARFVPQKMKSSISSRTSVPLYIYHQPDSHTCSPMMQHLRPCLCILPHLCCDVVENVH